MKICERIEFNRHSRLKNNSCFPKKEINRFDCKCEMVCDMFVLSTVPLRENFTGNCWSEPLGGKTCHMLPEDSVGLWTGQCYTFQEISCDVINKTYPQLGRLSDN